MSNSAGGEGRDRLAHDTGTLRYTGLSAPPGPQPSEPPTRKSGEGEEAEGQLRPMA